MFKNKTAWFSDSVKSDIFSFWASQGGIITNWRTADYLFSHDASCPDTRRIHQSDNYAMGRASVFHSSFLTACKVRQSARHVPLGCFLLPPISVQRQVKAACGRFIWEQDELPGEATFRVNGGTEQNLSAQSDDGGSLVERRKMRQSWTQTSPPGRETAQCKAQLVVSAFIHIDQLKKYSGEILDFCPPQAGCTISKCHTKLIYSSVNLQG